MSATEYELVAASQDDQALGSNGRKGDHLVHLVIQPSTIAPGTVVVKDGATVIYTYPGTADYPASLAPFHVLLDMKSVSGSWKITTGANVSVLAKGDFAG